VHSAERLEIVQTIGKQDPFVSLKLKDQSFKTRTCKDGGTNGRFEETFAFNRIGSQVEFNVILLILLLTLFNSISLRKRELFC
jgi:hypothetical protein